MRVSRVFFGLVLMAAACGDAGSDDKGSTAADGGSASKASANDAGDDNQPTGSCNKPKPADAFTEDAITATGSKVSCYYAPPTGYCVEQRNQSAAGQVAKDGKGAIGCKDAIVRVDVDCPKDTAIGRCDVGDAANPSEVRYYYPCNQFDGNANLMSPQYACENFLKGKYTKL